MEIELDPKAFGYRWEDLIAHLEALREQHGDDLLINVPDRIPVGRMIERRRWGLEKFGHLREDAQREEAAARVAA